MPALAIDNLPLPYRRAAAWWLGLFGLPFMAFAFWLLLTGVWPPVGEWARMSRWQPAEATLLAADLTVRPGSRGDPSREATATYRYTVGEAQYTSQRVGISRGGDNVGRHQAEMARTLVGYLQRGEPVRIWVNPANPTEAAIDRELRWDLLSLHAGFALVFGAIGMGLLFFALRLHRAPLPGPGLHAKGKAGENAPGLPRRYGNVWLHQMPGGVRVHLPYGRDLQRHIGAIAGGALFLGMALAIGKLMEREEVVPAIFAVVFGLLGVALSASSLFTLTTSLHANLDERGIRVRRRFLGLPLHSHQVPPGMVKRLELLHEQTTEHRGREIAWYRLLAQLKNGGTIALTDSLEGEDAARGLYTQVLERSGYRG
ncbi:hypothetical protein HNP48_007063 [Acidovorax soli]|uniref:DUF3592 domain-containing protein n=1 Tax=Acidovorax soli TaxID=592050 RepID=A0A7X0PMW9_9BURK|nr:DUF3592 domain-containing protein [Acidovorax soli]MBB6564336.1 hypothetical protein [Acidovorax soli]